MSQNKNFDDFSLKIDYVEEVPEKHLSQNKNDIIYDDSEKSKLGSRLLKILLLLLVFISLFCFVFGLIYFNGIGIGEKKVLNYDLNVTHSNNYYGGHIDSFEHYNSLKNAYNYSFNVSNDNSVDLDYKIEIKNPNFGNDNIDMTLIEYSLVKNNKVFTTGKFYNNDSFKIADVKIDSNSNDQFVLKVWSNKVNKNLKFSFKVNVTV